jgi:PAS domain S-box-containing protein
LFFAGVVTSAVGLLYLCASLARRTRTRHAQLLETLAEHSPDAIFAKDRSGRYTLFNRGAALIAGLSADAVLGRDDAALFPPPQAALIRDRDVQAMHLDAPITYEETLPTTTGPRTFHTTKGPLRNERGDVLGVFGIARDITERVREREALQHSEQRYRLAAAGGAVWDWDLQSNTGRSHSSFWQRLGHDVPPDDLALDSLAALIHPDDRERWRSALRDHLVHRTHYDLEFRARHRDGSWRWFQTQGQAMWNEAGRATYIAGTTVDVTERRQAEDALQRARAELQQLLRRLMEQERNTTARLAQSLHDRLGQVLGSARLHLDLAQAQAQSHPAAAQRLGNVSSLLDSAIQEVRRVLIDLRPPLLREQGLAAALDNEARRGAARGLDTEIALDVQADAQVRWPDQVEHAAFMVAREAIANALQHADARAIGVRLAGDGSSLDLRIDDDGRGIGEDAQRGRPGHLGLVGMRERAASIGAGLVIEPAPTRGTTVRLRWQA